MDEDIPQELEPLIEDADDISTSLQKFCDAYKAKTGSSILIGFAILPHGEESSIEGSVQSSGISYREACTSIAGITSYIVSSYQDKEDNDDIQ